MLNNGYIYSETISNHQAGKRVLDYLSARYRHTTREQWLEHIAQRRVRVDGEPAAAEHVLRLRQELAYHRDPWQEPDAPLDVAMLYDEGDVAVVFKPAGLPTMPGGGFLENTLVHQLRLTHGELAPMHRLGRWTSGAVLCTRSPEAGANIAKQFKKHRVYKRYRALAAGVAAQERYAITMPIGPVPYPPLGTLNAASPTGKPSASHAVVVKQRPESFLADVTIETGRPHQIRIHMASIGHPLVGDPLYDAGGQPFSDGTALPGDPGYALHAAEIRFKRPSTGEVTTVLAEPPELLRP